MPFRSVPLLLCIVQTVRNSLNYVSWKMRAEAAGDRKRIHTCGTVDEAEKKLAEFEGKGDTATRRSASPGARTGHASFRSSTIRTRSEKSFTPRTPSSR